MNDETVGSGLQAAPRFTGDAALLPQARPGAGVPRLCIGPAREGFPTQRPPGGLAVGRGGSRCCSSGRRLTCRWAKREMSPRTKTRRLRLTGPKNYPEKLAGLLGAVCQQYLRTGKAWTCKGMPRGQRHRADATSTPSASMKNQDGPFRP